MIIKTHQKLMIFPWLSRALPSLKSAEKKELQGYHVLSWPYPLVFLCSLWSKKFLFFISVIYSFAQFFFFQLSGIVCANCPQLVSLSLRAIPDRRKKADGVVNEIFLARLSLFSKNGTESSVSLKRAKNKTRKTITIKKTQKDFIMSQDSMRILSISLHPLLL